MILRMTQPSITNNCFNPLSVNPKKWSNTRNLPTNCLSVFDHFVKLALKGLIQTASYKQTRRKQHVMNLNVTKPDQTRQIMARKA